MRVVQGEECRLWSVLEGVPAINLFSEGLVGVCRVRYKSLTLGWVEFSMKILEEITGLTIFG